MTTSPAAEHDTVRYVRDVYGDARGEIASCSVESVAVAGPFPAGLALALRPGERVYVLTEAQLAELAGQATTAANCDCGFE